MKITVRELIDMIDSGKLHYNQSTQRKFVYLDVDANLEFGKTTKAGAVINSMLEKSIQLPSLFFWHNTDTGDLNIHDGKQRILSIYYFVRPQGRNVVSTKIRGKDFSNFASLSPEDQEKLMDYEFDVTEAEGDSRQEEESFCLINSNALPLTNYEILNGMHYGPFLKGFDAFLEQKSKTLDKVKRIERGEQAYKFLVAMFGLLDDKKAIGASNTFKLVSKALTQVRATPFDPSAYKFGQMLDEFNFYAKLGIKEDRAIALAATLVSDYGGRLQDIRRLYEDSLKKPNDVASWDMSTHKTFVSRFIDDGKILCAKRFFDKADKDRLYAMSPRCAHVDDDGTPCKETSYSKLEVDHIVPWCDGGQTTLDNAQLLCKAHNASKGGN